MTTINSQLPELLCPKPDSTTNKMGILGPFLPFTNTAVRAIAEGLTSTHEDRVGWVLQVLLCLYTVTGYDRIPRQRAPVWGNH